MTPRSLFIILVRVIGLFLLIDILRVIPATLKTFSLLVTSDLLIACISILFSLAILWIYYLVVKYALFKSEKLVEKFSLDKNFTEEKFDLTIEHSSIIKLAVIFIGGNLIIQYFVPMLLELYEFIQRQSQNLYYAETSTSNNMGLIQDVMMVLIGYFMVGNSRSIASYIETKAGMKQKDA
jgi:hypothetical protein